MRWEGERESQNVEDRRGMRVGRGASLGCGGLLLLVVFALLTGRDPQQLLDMVGGAGGPAQVEEAPVGGHPADEAGRFASTVLASTEDVWSQVLSSRGVRYSEPMMVLFQEAVASACGTASSAVGPFYCPADQKLYLDLSFFSELSRRFGAPGDFAAAYVIAHEVGHHVQNLMGISEQVQNAQRRMSQEEGNALSVRLELQADCLAGVWANHANQQHHWLEAGDLEEALNAAQAIGDDRLQSMATGYVQPESWTHGSSEMRQRWLRRGLESGDIRNCDTFQSGRL